MARNPVLVTLALCACSAPAPRGGDPSDAGTTPSPAAVPLDGFVAAFLDGICASTETCVAFGSVRPFHDRASCVAAMKAKGYDTALQTVVDLVGAGKAAYDAALARTCLDELIAGCSSALSDPRITIEAASSAACNGFVKGIAPVGAPCVTGFTCASGACNATREACGICVARVELGGTCQWWSECDTGTSCNVGTCQPWPVNGGTQAGDACNPAFVCSSTLFCENATKTCKARLAEGASCIGGDVASCADGFTCNAQHFDAAGVCVRLPHLGDPCHIDSFSPSDDCFEGRCTPKGNGFTCQPAAPLGGACMSSHQCAAQDLWCTSGTCKPVGQAGDACDSTQPSCGVGLVCTSGKCQVVGGPNATCSSPLECGPGLVCDVLHTNRCVESKVGSLCEFGYCGGDLRCSGSEATATCVACDG